MVLGIQTNKKWKRTFDVDNLFQVHIFLMQIAGHWPVDYAKYLPSQLACLSRYMNIVFMSWISFLNAHMSVLYFVNFLKDSQTDATMLVLTDSLMSTILHAYSFFGGFYIQINYKKMTKMFAIFNEGFRKRSARGKFYAAFFYTSSEMKTWRLRNN